MAETVKTGAVITAAGLSSRMGDFKPMLEIGGVSFARRIIATLKEAGINEIVVVTGHNADELEAHLAGSGAVFIRNNNYRDTQMFDSACIGFRYMLERCDRIIFTPVDIPLFRADTVKALLRSSASITYPLTGGRRGHPVIIDAETAKKILADSGENGLKGAFARCAGTTEDIDADDRGTLRDADTPDEYQTLKDYYGGQQSRSINKKNGEYENE